ncbi:enterochelin esterase domain-containing protein [Vibrio albus]|nr:enterochelin esterase domain-containing protein [Vibrio albus]
MLNNQEIRFILDDQQTFRQELTLTANRYLTGDIWSDAPINNVFITDKTNHPIKQFMPLPGHGADIHFRVPASGTFILTVEGKPNTEGTIHLSEKSPADTSLPPKLLSPRLQSLTTALQHSQKPLTQFWQEVQETGTPLVEPLQPYSPDDPRGKSILTFLWRGKPNHVRLLGGPSADHPELIRLADTDVWYLSFIIPNDTQLSYQLAPDVPDFAGTDREKRRAILATAQKDPLNHHPWHYLDSLDKYSTWSTVRLPAAHGEKWLDKTPEKKGTVVRHNVVSKQLGNQRAVYIYRSPELEKEIPQVKALFISNPSAKSRASELACNPTFSDALVSEILPDLAKEENLGTDNKILIGSSYGGLISACTAIKYPDMFSGVLSLSGSFWWKEPGEPNQFGQEKWVISQLAQNKTLPVRWFITAGIFENTWIYPSNEELRSVLQAKGYSYRFEPVSSSHDMLSWRSALPSGLIYLLN